MRMFASVGQLKNLQMRPCREENSHVGLYRRIWGCIRTWKKEITVCYLQFCLVESALKKSAPKTSRDIARTQNPDVATGFGKFFITTL